VFCTYNFYLDQTPYKSNVISGKAQNPQFNYRKQHSIDCVTENMLRYFQNECLTVKIYGYPDLKKSKKEIDYS